MYDKEHEADVNAVSAIKCPICTQLIADEWPADTVNGSGYRLNFGYLSSKDVQNLQVIKMDDDICQAHGAYTQGPLQLRALMPDQNK